MRAGMLFMFALLVLGRFAVPRPAAGATPTADIASQADPPVAGARYTVPKQREFTVLCEGSEGTIFVVPGTAWRLLGRIKEGLRGLCGTYRVVRLNYRGVPFGRNKWEERAAHEALVAEAIDSGERSHLVGYSQGTSLTLQILVDLGATRVRSVASVVLVAPAGKVNVRLHAFAPKEIDRMEARWNNGVAGIERRLADPEQSGSYAAVLGRTVVVLAADDVVVLPEGLGHITAWLGDPKIIPNKGHIAVQADPEVFQTLVEAERPAEPESEAP